MACRGIFNFPAH